MNKEFLVRLLVIVSVLVSGLGLSLFYVVRINYFDILMILFAPSVALIFVSKQYWFRVIAFAFLIGGLYGLGRIGLNVGHGMENMESMAWGKYSDDLMVYLLYTSIWFVWWIKDSRKGSPKA